MPQIEEAGGHLVVISPEIEEHNRELTKKANLTFDILTDRDNQIAEQFGLAFRLPDDLQEVYRQFGADLQKFNGDASWRLPMPARFIVAQDSIIRYAQADPDYRRRPEPQHTITALQQVRATA